MTPSAVVSAGTPAPRSWLDRIWSSVADRGRPLADALRPHGPRAPLDRIRELAGALLSERGEASGAAIARELLKALRELDPEQRVAFYRFLAENFLPPEAPLKAAAEAYLADPTPDHATRLAEAAEPVRQELLRRVNMAPGGTAALVGMRKDLLAHLNADPALKPLDADLRHLLASWFNRGFLELRRIDWQTPAAVLEKLIAYEAVHEIQGWDDLRRRLAPDRRCFGFFHPALPGEPLIFVEVALTSGLAASVQPLLAQADTAAGGGEADPKPAADTAIFYSISNCQDGLRGVSFGNFLIKQVVEELKGEAPGLQRFATLSPVPGFRRWLERRLSASDNGDLLTAVEVAALAGGAPIPGTPAPGDPAKDGVAKDGVASDGAAAAEQPAAVLRARLDAARWWDDEALAEALRTPLLRLCAVYLTTPTEGRGPADPVARFHLGNGARLERVNWRGNLAPRGMRESYGIMVNYLYDPEQIEANHEAFVRGVIIRSATVEALLEGSANAPAPTTPRPADRTRKGKG